MLKERASEKPSLSVPGPGPPALELRNTCLLFNLLVSGFVMAALADGPGVVFRVHLIADEWATVGLEKEVEPRNSCGKTQSTGSGTQEAPNRCWGSVLA